jgi:hypothetical protein
MKRITFLGKCLLTALTSALAILVLTHVYLLGRGIATDQYLTFWLPILAMGFLVFYATISLGSRFPLVLILIFALTLHLINFVRQPDSMVWNTDAIYVLQLVNHVSATGHWNFAYGTGESFAYSYYPLMYVFMSILSSVLSISTMEIVKYSMAVINIVTLLSLYALLGGLFDLDPKSKNVAVFIFSLNPIFHGFDSYAHAESFAIILFPLVLLYILGQKNSFRSFEKNVVAVILLILIMMSHHFTSYMVALALLVPAALLYLKSRSLVGKRHLYILAALLPLAWLAFVANWIFDAHVRASLDIIQRLTSVQTLVGYSSGVINISAAYYPSAFFTQLTLLSNVLLILISLIGFMWYRRLNNTKVYNHFRLLLLFYLGLTFLLLYLVDWTKISIADARDRIVAFSYLPLALFSALGIETMSDRIRRKLWNKSAWKVIIKPAAVCLFVLIFLPPMIFEAFPRLIYDSTYHPITSGELSVAPEEHYAVGRWVNEHVNSSSKDVFTGSLSAERYVVGYGLFHGTWSLQMFDVAKIPNSAEYSISYVVNMQNLQLPDQFGQKVNATTLQELNSRFNKLYDNGQINLFELQPQPGHFP